MFGLYSLYQVRLIVGIGAVINENPEQPQAADVLSSQYLLKRCDLQLALLQELNSLSDPFVAEVLKKAVNEAIDKNLIPINFDAKKLATVVDAINSKHPILLQDLLNEFAAFPELKDLDFAQLYNAMHLQELQVVFEADARLKSIIMASLAAAYDEGCYNFISKHLSGKVAKNIVDKINKNPPNTPEQLNDLFRDRDKKHPEDYLNLNTVRFSKRFYSFDLAVTGIQADINPGVLKSKQLIDDRITFLTREWQRETSVTALNLLNKLASDYLHYIESSRGEIKRLTIEHAKLQKIADQLENNFSKHLAELNNKQAMPEEITAIKINRDSIRTLFQAKLADINGKIQELNMQKKDLSITIHTLVTNKTVPYKVKTGVAKMPVDLKTVKQVDKVAKKIEKAVVREEPELQSATNTKAKAAVIGSLLSRASLLAQRKTPQSTNIHPHK